MKQQSQDPIVLTGFTYVIGALADIFQSKELDPKRAKTGDMKLWCQRGERVWNGQFRAAVFDGKNWRTFRLNIVADKDARYDSFDDRRAKARRCFTALGQLKGETARVREGTYGCTFTMKATVAPVKPADTTPAPAVTAARTTQTPPLGTGTKVTATGRKRRRKAENPNQLKLF